MNLVMRRLAVACVVLSGVGLALSLYSMSHHAGFTSGALCDINSTFNCDVVNRGPFSEIVGIPVALLGIIAYLFFGATALLKLRHPHDHTLSLFLLLSTAGGFIFSLYLSSIEAFVLHTWCVVCLTSQFTVGALCALAAVQFWKERTAPKFVQAEESIAEAVDEIKDLYEKS